MDLYKQIHRNLSSPWCRWDNLAENEMRNFALREKDGTEIEVFTGKAPRQAVLPTEVIQTSGTMKIHVFTGERVQVKKPKGTCGCRIRYGSPKSRKLVNNLETLEPPLEK
jgi:hypothetical protein